MYRDVVVEEAMPFIQTAARGGAGILRIERKQYDLIAFGCPQMFNRFRGEWMPVAHGHEAAGVDAGFRQLELQGAGLLFGKTPDGRASADDRIMMLNFFGACAGNQLRQGLAAQAGKREVDDIGVAKKIKKER